MAPPLLILQDVHLTFGGEPVLEGAELIVGEGDRLGLVGRNGSGKSTFMKIAAGLIESDRGERSIAGGTTLRYLPQEPDLSGFATTLAFVEAGLAPGDEPHRASYLLNELGLTGEEEPSTLSGGEARRCALARTLAPRPDILLLDEPTNHLDLPAIEWLEAELQAHRGALVIISHDRRFLANLTQITVWLDRGQTRRLERGFGEFEAWRDQVLETEAAERHRLDRKIAAETEWLRYGVTARRKRNMGRLRALQDLRAERRSQRMAQGQVRITVTEAGQSGKLVIEGMGLSKAFGDRAVVRDLDLLVRRGDRLGIIGPNGSGKTTLLKLLTGELPPDAGSLKLGVNLEIQTLDQRRAALEPARGLVETLTGGRGDTVFVGGAPRHVMSYMQDFLFTPDQARTPVAALSGGERGRLMLALALSRPSNILVLDEPTNDLDLETLDLLEDMLGTYPGTVLLVSHDRDFLDRVATSVLASEGDGRWLEYAGGYSDMVAQRGHGVVARRIERPAEPRRPRPASPPPLPPRRRLSSKERRALEILPDRIAGHEALIQALEARLGDPDLFRRDPAAFAEVTQSLERERTALGRAESDWLELEMLREELEG